jgi:steroid delta-isomerase
VLKALLLLLLAPTMTRAQAEPDSSAAARAIRSALADWVAAANREDWKAASVIWAPDLVGWYPGQPDDTYAGEMERAAHPRSGRPKMRYRVQVMEVIVSGRLAVVRDIWRFTSLAQRSDSSVSTVRSYEVWKQQPDDKWKIARWISAPEPAQP